jgi:hypothetical protein
LVVVIPPAVDSKSGRDGISRTTVEVITQATESDNYTANGRPSIGQALTDRKGVAETGTGRVESVEVVNISILTLTGT